MRVKPAPGIVVRDPATKRALPADGADVPESIYWTRRLRAGDVVRIDQAAGKAAERPRPEVDPVSPLATRNDPTRR